MSVQRHAPLHIQVGDTLIADIERGRYPVGSLLPSETELAERFAVSRHTVREAARRLAEIGLVERRPGIGTRVKTNEAQARYVAFIAALEDLFEYTRNTRLAMLEERLVAADNELAELLGCRPGQRWLSFVALRYPIGATRPIAHMTAYVPPTFEDIRQRLHEEGVSVYRLVEEHSGQRMNEARQRVEAIALPGDIALLLDTKPGEPALRVARSYLGEGGRLVSASVNVHPSDRFALVTGWRLDWRPPL